jgi:hypothetical protein
MDAPCRAPSVIEVEGIIEEDHPDTLILRDYVCDGESIINWSCRDCGQEYLHIYKPDIVKIEHIRDLLGWQLKTQLGDWHP